jgi:hypothetical protein
MIHAPQEGYAVGRYSQDDGKTFGDFVRLFPLDTSLGSWSMHNAFLDQEGELQLIYINDENTFKEHKPFYETRLNIWHVRSRNQRRNWSPPKLIWKGYAGSLLSFVQLKNGRVLLPFTYLTRRTWAERGTGFDAFTFMGRFSSTSAYSDDQGKTWIVSPTELKEPTPQIGVDGGIEPIVLELKDGRVWMLIRTQWGRFYESFSSDHGATWSQPVPTNLLSSDSPCSLTRLRDGRIVMMWNNTQRYCYANGGRVVLHAAISEDDGKSWRGYREVAANPFAKDPPPPHGDHGVTYTVPVLTHDGHIATSLTLGGPDGGYRLLRFDPEWLYETARQEDFSQGLANWQYFGTHGVTAQAHPEKAGRQVLSLQKPDAGWPAGALWNFPAGYRGELRLRFQLREGFAGAVVGLTDHFSVPFDAEDVFYNLFNVELLAGGAIKDGGCVELQRWHDLLLRWDTTLGKCTVCINGREIVRVRQIRVSTGPSYLRLRSTTAGEDHGGLLVESVAVDTSSSRV